MELSIRGMNFDLTDAILGHVQRRLDGARRSCALARARLHSCATTQK